MKALKICAVPENTRPKNLWPKRLEALLVTFFKTLKKGWRQYLCLKEFHSGPLFPNSEPKIRRGRFRRFNNHGRRLLHRCDHCLKLFYKWHDLKKCETGTCEFYV